MGPVGLEGPSRAGRASRASRASGASKASMPSGSFQLSNGLVGALPDETRLDHTWTTLVLGFVHLGSERRAVPLMEVYLLMDDRRALHPGESLDLDSRDQSYSWYPVTIIATRGSPY